MQRDEGFILLRGAVSNVPMHPDGKRQQDPTNSFFKPFSSLQGSGGAYEVSQRMTALIGWSGTSGFVDKWVYDGAAET